MRIGLRLQLWLTLHRHLDSLTNSFRWYYVVWACLLCFLANSCACLGLILRHQAFKNLTRHIWEDLTRLKLCLIRISLLLLKGKQLLLPVFLRKRIATSFTGTNLMTLDDCSTSLLRGSSCWKVHLNVWVWTFSMCCCWSLTHRCFSLLIWCYWRRYFVTLFFILDNHVIQWSNVGIEEGTSLLWSEPSQVSIPIHISSHTLI